MASEDTTSSYWGDKDKFGQWKCRYFSSDLFWEEIWKNLSSLDLTSDPDVGPRFWLLADSIRQNQNQNVLEYPQILNRTGTLGLSGKKSTVQDEIYIVHVYLTKSGNLKVLPYLFIRIQTIKMSQIVR